MWRRCINMLDVAEEKPIICWHFLHFTLSFFFLSIRKYFHTSERLLHSTHSAYPIFKMDVIILIIFQSRMLMSCNSWKKTKRQHPKYRCFDLKLICIYPLSLVSNLLCVRLDPSQLEQVTKLLSKRLGYKCVWFFTFGSVARRPRHRILLFTVVLQIITGALIIVTISAILVGVGLLQ